MRLWKIINILLFICLIFFSLGIAIYCITDSGWIARWIDWMNSDDAGE